MNHKGVPNDRRSRLQIARSLQGQLMFYEGEWGSRILQDSVEGVYVFLDDDGSNPPREALPTSVVTILARCYSPSCGEGPECYASRCPQKHGPNINSHKIDADPDVISCFRGGVKDRATPRRGPWQTQAIMAPGTANSFAGANNFAIHDSSFVDIGQQTLTYTDCHYHTTFCHYVSPSPTHPANPNATPWIAVVAILGVRDTFNRLRGGNAVACRPGAYVSAVDEIVSVSRQVFRDHPLPASVCLYFLILRLLHSYRSRALQG